MNAGLDFCSAVANASAAARLSAAIDWAQSLDGSGTLSLLLEAFSPIAGIDLSTSQVASAYGLGTWGDARMAVSLSDTHLQIVIHGDGPTITVMAELPSHLQHTIRKAPQ